jgi:hypothetical protein
MPAASSTASGGVVAFSEAYKASAPQKAHPSDAEAVGKMFQNSTISNAHRRFAAADVKAKY